MSSPQNYSWTVAFYQAGSVKACVRLYFRASYCGTVRARCHANPFSEVYMKLPQTITILALTAVLAVMSVPALAQQPSSAPMPQDQQEQQAPPQSSDNQIQTFQGTIARSQGQYILNSASGATYQLDDQKSAKAYAGRSVKVTGTLDASGNMIHVSSIEPAA
jgi:hypothetical protein